MRKLKLVFFTGAGISQESGLATFRDSGGLWEQYKIEDVATPDAWQRNPELVTVFYNLRRKQLMEAHPNQAHIAIAYLERDFDVQIITQNVDDLHERAGSTRVLHLHGELMKVRSEKFPELIYPCRGWEVKIGDTCERGAQLRPHVVWFGEQVPNMELATTLVADADIFVVVGTSLEVYPAAFLIHDAPNRAAIYLIDPNDVSLQIGRDVIHIKERATSGMARLMKILQ